jgi:hypothetical protein
MRRRGRLALTLAVLVSAGSQAQAENPKAPADPGSTDADLLEFLGSVDSAGDSPAPSDDGSWIDYLSQTDISKVARTSNPDAARARQAAPGRQPVPSGDKKDD